MALYIRKWWAGLGGLALLLGVGAGACEVGFEERNPAGRGPCETDCVPKLSGLFYFWAGPVLLWLGAPSETAPACPLPALGNAAMDSWPFVGGAPPTEAACVKECACAPPACALPAVVEANTSSMCQGPPETRTPFLPPADWDGACVAPPPVPAERVGSIRIGPVTEQTCVESATLVSTRGSSWSGWSIAASVCFGGNLLDDADQFYRCGRNDAVCMTYRKGTDLSPWRQCILTNGDASCPPGPYTEKMPLLHSGADEGECAPCQCAPTTPSRCEAVVTLYEDASCSEVNVTSRVTTLDVCLDPGLGPAMRSLGASWVVNEPGACTPEGGGTSRPPALIGTTTLCCLPKTAAGDEMGLSLDDEAEKNERP